MAFLAGYTLLKLIVQIFMQGDVHPETGIKILLKYYNWNVVNIISVLILWVKVYFIINVCYFIIIEIMKSIISARKGCV